MSTHGLIMMGGYLNLKPILVVEILSNRSLLVASFSFLICVGQKLCVCESQRERERETEKGCLYRLIYCHELQHYYGILL